jgi:AraC-like DNA-binding protein
VAPELADKYLSDDQWVLRHGRPRRNIIEMWFNEQGVRDWIITDKYPLRDARGKVVGLLGTIQTLQGRRGMLAHLGPVGKAADYIRDHLGEPLRVSEIARHAGFSERQLERLFRRAFGMTIQQFVIHSRIHAATYELTHSGRTIADIATMFGFSDQSAFTNQFRDITGMTPRVYRDRYVAELTP